jgi:hypothetical protein
VEVFALVYLQIVIIAAPIAISYGDSMLVLDRKVQGIKMIRVVFPAPLTVTCVGGRGYHEP